MVAGVAKRQKVIGTGKSVGKMDPRDNKKSKTLATNLAMRDKPKPQPQLFGATEATRTQRTTSDATQTTRSSLNKESGRRNNSHIHSINGQASNPATGLQTQITSALESSIGTTDAIPPGSERRSSNSDSIDLCENPEHPHACDINRDIQEFTKPFDRNDEKSNKY